jgi:hypothetical protein
MRPDASSRRKWVAPAWLDSHVRDDLVFGAFYRTIPFVYVIGLVGVIFLVVRLVALGKSGLGQWHDALVYLFLIYGFQRMSVRGQATIAFVVVKATIACGSLILVFAGLLRLSDGFYVGGLLLTLGVIWFPGFDFVPAIVRYQKSTAALRCLLSLPLLLLIARAR